MYTHAKGPITIYSFGKYVIKGSEHAEKPDGSTGGIGKEICVTGKQVTACHERKGHGLTLDMCKPALAYLLDLLISSCGAQPRPECPLDILVYLKKKGTD